MNWKEHEHKVQEAVLRRLDMSAEALFWMRIDNADAFLRLHYDADTQSAYMETPAFWAWWRQIWTQRDEHLLERLDRCSQGFLMAAEDYAKYHDPAFVRYRPNNVIRHYMLVRVMAKLMSKEKAAKEVVR